ncbi:hypothetical protein GALMADRAFT_236141 [Galerina marginata CBS 339.88]|uniref:Uncharacterized protein n=1 Tax=Galerina marginata (strain CBS 339.88) TaxID=685588 RepID=A0A067TKT2_GALM3|nr:hypothetical protein GALMADRAFT_236141 [Galerina marginata CBS 339.88]
MQSDSSSEELAAALADGNVLLGTSSSSHTTNSMQTLLKNRLLAYYDRLSRIRSTDGVADVSTIEDLHLLTARESVSVLERVQRILSTEEHERHPGNEANPTQAPSIGTRDLAQLRTLLSLAFKWGSQLLFTRISRPWLSLTVNRGVPKIIDLTPDSNDYHLLTNMLRSLFSLVFPEGPEGPISQTLITTSVLARHVPDLLLPAIALGWLPEAFSSGSIIALPEARPLVTRILKFLSPAQAIVSLGGIVSSTSPPPPLHVRKTCTVLLSQQLLRPEGVQGLYEATFSADETMGDEVKIEKLEQVARILNTPPANMNAQEYYRLIFPRVLKSLTSHFVTHRRAAAYTFYRAVVPQKASLHQPRASVVLEILHSPFIDRQHIENQQISRQPVIWPREALLSLTNLVSNTEPSPLFISKILSPIVSSLYLLSYDLEQIKTVDPSLKESITSLLIAWGKIVDQTDGTNILWSIIRNGKDGQWKLNLEGQFWKIKNSDESSQSSLLFPGDVLQTEDDFDADLNLFNLYPDPAHFVQLLKLFDRGDIASALFLRLLENYRDMKGRPGEDSMRILHELQIIILMQNRLSEGTNSNILRKPDQLLSFIFHVLDSASITVQGNQASSLSNGNSQIPSRPSIENEDMFEEGDSDDEAPDSEVIGPDDELVETAITLLLSILEADETLSVRSHPILNDIFSNLEPLALKSSSSALRPLAREARLVVTARLAHAAGATRPRQNTKGEESEQEIYQRALKLLQDPILPVRGHGLLLLRQLVGPAFSKDSHNKALLPSILSIFLQSVQDEDSYIFLNAVQGLAALVDNYGKEILQGLVHDYADGLEGLGAGNLTQHDIDIRTRIGEALSSVIKRCGNALGLYVDILVPRLFATVRGFNIPTALRTSALSLLADSVDTYHWAMLPYIEDLCQGMVDLLQVESQTLREGELQPKSLKSDSQGEEPSPSKPTPSTMDSDPTSRNHKFPPLRRAALHFLSLLIRASTKIVYEETGKATSLLSATAFQRVSLTLGYISFTDEDNIVRVMAREAKENLEELQRAAFGL